jgi:hypothetical protein
MTMARTDEALEILQKADGPLTTKEVFERSNEFQGAAEACWAINTLMKSGKVIAVGKKPQVKGPDRIAYAVADGKTRAAGPAPKPKPQATRPVAKPKPAQASARPSAKSPQAAAESKSAPDMRDENAPPPGHIGADEQPCRYAVAVAQGKLHMIVADLNCAWQRRAKQREVALSLDVFPELASHERRLDDPGQLRQAGLISRENEAGAGVAGDVHGLHRFYAIGCQVLPDADFLEKRGIRRRDRVNSRVPSGGPRWSPLFDQADLQAGLAQCARQRQAGQAATGAVVEQAGPQCAGRCPQRNRSGLSGVAGESQRPATAS